MLLRMISKVRPLALPPDHTTRAGIAKDPLEEQGEMHPSSALVVAAILRRYQKIHAHCTCSSVNTLDFRISTYDTRRVSAGMTR
jgi:hypothetical protein